MPHCTDEVAEAQEDDFPEDPVQCVQDPNGSRDLGVALGPCSRFTDLRLLRFGADLHQLLLITRIIFRARHREVSVGE